MKKPLVIVLLACAMLAGCCNIMTRTECETEPYACAPYPYYCTWEDMKVLAVPFSDPTGPEGSIAKAFATVFFPLFLIDLPFEAALDTVFLPADLTYLCTKEGK